MSNWLEDLQALIKTLESLDGVYVDTVNGVAGTAWPIGTPSDPSNNLANVRTICTNRKLKKIYVRGVLTLDDAMKGYAFVGEGDPFDDTAYIDVNGKDVDNSVFIGLRVKGIVGGTGYYPFFLDCLLGDITFKGWAFDCVLEDTFTFASGVDCDMYNCRPMWESVGVSIGDPSCIAFHDWSGGLTVKDMTAGLLRIYANGADINPGGTCTGGTITIWGSAKILDGTGGGCTVNDHTIETKLADIATQITTVDTVVDAIKAVTDAIKGAAGIFHEQADVALNVSVDNTENDLFDLSTASTRYIVRSLRVKCVDPGAGETVTIRLYQLINDGATLIDSFVIDHDNYMTYFSLMDMFGVPHLAGDDLHVVAIGSVAGPVALTGQYSYAKTNV